MIIYLNYQVPDYKYYDIDITFQRQQEQYIHHPDFDLLSYSHQLEYLYTMVHNYIQLFITNQDIRLRTSKSELKDCIIKFYDMYITYDDKDIEVIYSRTADKNKKSFKYLKPIFKTYQEHVKKLDKLMNDGHISRDEYNLQKLEDIHTLVDVILQTDTVYDKDFNKCCDIIMDACIEKTINSERP